MQQKNPRIELICYDAVDGIPTFADSFIMGLYERMKAQGSLSDVFYAYDPQLLGPEQFLDLFKFGSNRLWVIFHNGEVSGFFWLNDFAEKSAMIHYCFFKNIWGPQSAVLGRYILDYLLGLRSETGPVFDVITGLTPVTNRLAVRFLEKVGMTVVGKIPNRCLIFTDRTTVPGIVSYRTRKA